MFDNFNDSIIPWVGKTGKALGCFLHWYFEQNDIDLTREQWLLLMHLSKDDGQMQNDLAIITSRDKASLARLVSNMEKKHLVVRIASKVDKRVKHVYLTNMGRDIFEKTLPLLDQVEPLLHEGITKEEIEVVIKVMKKLQNNIRNYEQNSCSTN